MGDYVLLYSRELPGGGIVTIEAVPPRESGYVARVSVERRSDPQRRVGHAPPVIAEANGDSPEAALRQLYPIAADNVAIARGLIQWQMRHRHHDRA
jgi:hypothetical protein